MVSSLKPKIATLVKGQTPSYFEQKYPQFITFLEKYFEHLESNGNPLNFVRNILENHDYDQADDYFKALMEKGVLSNLPTSLNIDRGLLIKNARNIYRQKGTEESYRFILNALFGETAELEWGKDRYVRLNDSTFKQDNIITVRYPKLSAQAYINQARVTAVRLTNNDNGFDMQPTVKLIRNDPASKDIPVFDFNLSGYITSVIVKNGGYGYTTASAVVTGDLLPGGTPASVSVHINPDSSISNISVINPGTGYTEQPTITITGDGEGAEIETNWTATLHDISITHGGSGFSKAPQLQFVGGSGTITTGSTVLPARDAEVSCTINTNGVIDTVKINYAGQNYQYKPTLKLKWLPDTDAILEPVFQGNKVVDVRIMDGGTGYTVPPTVVFEHPEPDLMGLQGNRIEQTQPSYATAIVEDVVEYTVGGENLYVLYLSKNGMKGTFEVGSVIAASFNDISYNAIITPLVTGVGVEYPGSMYAKGQRITMGYAGGIGGRGSIESVSRGSVDEVIVTKGGQNYRVGDEVVAASHATGSNFSGVVKTIDGIGADVTPVMEIDSYVITDTGHGYVSGDMLYIYGGPGSAAGLPNTAWAQAQVTGITASNNLLGFNVTAAGSGYTNGVSFAILPSAGSTSPLRQVRADKKSYVNGVLEGSTGNVSYTLSPANGISSLTWKLTNSDLADSTVTLAVNGVNAAISIASVNGSGAITGLTISNGGINYTNPRLIFAAGATRTATIDLTTNANGAITGYTIVDGGAGYTTSIGVTVTESFGAGAAITPIMDIGGVLNLNFITRGEVTEINKLDGTPYTIMGGSGTGLKLDLYYRPKKMQINASGEFYTSYALTASGGHGTGAIIKPVIKSGVVIDFSISNYGLNYAYCNVSVNSANGYGFEGVVNLDSNGTITGITVVNGGQGYQTGESLIFAGVAKVGTSITTAVGTLNTVRNGVITDCLIYEPGELYHPDCIITLSNAGSPTRNALLSPIISGGSVTKVVISDGGAGYSQNTTATVGYLESSSDVDPVPLFRGVGDYNNYAAAVTKTASGVYMASTITVSNNTSLVNGLVVEGTGIAYGTTITNVSGTTITLSTPLIKTINGVTLTFVPVNHVTYRGATANTAQQNTGYTQIFPTKNFCLVNSVFPVLDFVDIWPDVTAKPVDATYNIYSKPMGQIISAEVVSGGSGYFSREERTPLSLTISGNGTGAVLKPVLKDGSFTDVIILEGGQGYNSGAIVNVIPSYGKGYGAKITANVVAGQVTSYTVVNGGSGYVTEQTSPYVLSGPAIEIVGSGTNAAAHAVVVNGVITSVVPDNVGSGYDKPVITAVGGQISGTQAEFEAIVTEGVITGVYIKNAGTGYFYGTSVYVLGNGIDGALDVDVETGITDIVIIDGGSGYGTSPTSITITDNPPTGVPAGTGAVFHPIISSPTEGGVITGIQIIEKGKGYYNPTVTISGSGSGANIAAIARRPIIGVHVKTPGHNYVDASAIVVGDGQGAKLKVAFSRNSIDDIQIPYSGRMYSSVPNINIVDNSNFGAISSIKILDHGSGYEEVPSLTVNPINRVPSDPTPTSGEVVAYSTSIGKVHSIRFDEFAIGEDFIPTISFPITAVMSENSAFMINEPVYVKDYDYQTSDYTDGPRAIVQSVDYDRNIVTFTQCTDEYTFVTEDGQTIELETGTTNDVIGSQFIIHEDSQAIPKTATLVGVYSGVEGKILRMNRAYGSGQFGALGITPTQITSSRSYLNDNRAFIHNNERYQDFSYIINTGISIDNYKKFVDKILHPAGYALFGNIKIYTNLKSKITFPMTEEGRLLQEVVVLWLTLQPFYGKAVSHEFWRLESDRPEEWEFDTIDDVDTMLQDGIYSYETYPADIFIMGSTLSGTYSQVSNTLTVTYNNHGFSAYDVVRLTFTSGNAMSEMYSIQSVTTNTFTIHIDEPDTTSGNVTINKVSSRMYGADTFYPWVSGKTYNINDCVFTGDAAFLARTRHVSSSYNNPEDEMETFVATVPTNGSYVITDVPSTVTPNLKVGQKISVFAGTPTLPDTHATITSIDSATQISISLPFTGSGTVEIAYEASEPYWIPYYKTPDTTYTL